MSNFLDQTGLAYFWQKLKAIFDTIEVGTASGKFLNVTDAAAGKTVKSLALYNSSGTEVTGKTVAITNKNLFRLDLIPNSSTNLGITFTKNADGSVTGSGTSTGSYASVKCNIDKNAFVQGQVYAMDCGKTSGSLYIQLALTYTDNTTDYLVSSVSQTVFMVAKPVKTAVGSVQVTNSGTTVNQTVWPQIEVAGAATAFVKNSYTQITYNGNNLPTLPATTSNVWSNDDTVETLVMTYYQDTASAFQTSTESTASVAMVVAGKQDQLTPGANVQISGNTISATDTVYTHPTYTAKSSGLYKVTVDGTGHVSAATAVEKSDITALGIPAQDTTYSDATTSAHGLMSTTDKTKLDGIATGANNYTHPSYTAASAAAIKVGRDASGHVVTGAALTASDVGAAASSHSHSTATTSAAGFLPQLGGGTTNFLRADGTWAAPAGGTTKSSITVTLTANGWSNYSQTKTASGVTANNDVIITPDPASVNDYVNAGILCTAQAANSLTFQCSDTPTSAITVNVLILT